MATHYEYCPNCRHTVEVRPPDPPGISAGLAVLLTVGFLMLTVNLALTIYVFRYVAGVVSLFQ